MSRTENTIVSAISPPSSTPPTVRGVRAARSLNTTYSSSETASVHPKEFFKDALVTHFSSFSTRTAIVQASGCQLSMLLQALATQQTHQQEKSLRLWTAQHCFDGRIRARRHALGCCWRKVFSSACARYAPPQHFCGVRRPRVVGRPRQARSGVCQQYPNHYAIHSRAVLSMYGSWL